MSVTFNHGSGEMIGSERVSAQLQRRGTDYKTGHRVETRMKRSIYEKSSASESAKLLGSTPYGLNESV